jgi:phage tail-like protein
MDANGQRFWMWSKPADWPRLEGTALGRDRAAGDVRHATGARPLLTLRAERPAPARIAGAERETLAETALNRLPLLRDRLGTYARWDVPTQTLVGFGALAGEVPRYATATATAPRALALDHDDVLLLALADRIELVDLRDRFAPLRLTTPDFSVHALACGGRGARWALDRSQRRLARIAGTPWPDRAGVTRAPGTFRPLPENPDAPRLEVLPTPLPAGWRPVALACSAQDRLALAHWAADGELHLQLFDAQGRPQGSTVLEGGAHAHALAWLDETTVALRVADLDEVLVYALPAALDANPTLAPLGRRYPSADAAPGPFVAAQAWPPHLPLAQPPDAALAGTGSEAALRFSRPLVPLAWRAWRPHGGALGRVADSGRLGLEWHRLYLEATIPAGCGVLVELAAADDGAEPSAWWPHWFGDAEALSAVRPAPPPDLPRGAWQREASELPHRAGLLDCLPQPGRVGLFGVLVQRAGQRLRALRGRFLHVRVQLFGNGRSTPEVAALRAWGERFSYVRRYLPELYRDETEFDRSAPGPATPHDFLERYTQLFESVLTPLEDRVAEARVLTHPLSTPDAALPWLADWTGDQFPAALPVQARRAWLRSAPALRRLRGTLGGLQLGLDIATGGDVGRGRIVVVEDFRLRRTLATLLGVDLADADDALQPGLVVSGNSRVGDTLVLGDTQDAAARREFLALFGGPTDDDSDTESTREAASDTVAGVYARTAHRATVLVHDALDDSLQRRIASIAEELAPAHVRIKVLAAREPLLVGIASLVGVDTWLRAPQPPATARLDTSTIGRGDRLRGGGAFDWRLEDGVPGPASEGEPQAVLQAPPLHDPARPLRLDGSASRPPASGEIVRWRFTRND